MANSSSLFKSRKFDLINSNFDFTKIDRLLAENWLFNFIESENFDSKEITSIDDCFQKNYLESQIQAFYYAITTVPKKINFSWLHYLHSIATRRLTHEDGAEIESDVRSEVSHLKIIDDLNSFVLGGLKKGSSEGIKELYKHIHAMGLKESESGLFLKQKDQITDLSGEVAGNIFAMHEMFFAENEEEIKKIVLDIVHEYLKIKKFPEDFILNKNKEEDIRLLGFKIFTNKKIDKSIINDFYQDVINAIKDKLDVPPLYFSSIHYVLPSYSGPVQVRAKAQKLIDQYNEAPKKQDDEAINAVIRFVKGLLNLHLWGDGNGRVCAHHVMNALLMENGFSPTFLDNNCLDAFSESELCERVKEGMLKFKKMCIPNIENNSFEEMKIKYKAEEYYGARTLGGLYPDFLRSDDRGQFFQAIINDDMALAKKLFLKIVNDKTFTYYDLQMLASHQDADINWFSDYFKTNDTILLEFTEWSPFDFFIYSLIPLCVGSANINFLKKIIDYMNESNLFQKYIEENKEELRSVFGDIAHQKLYNTITSILICCDVELFSKIEYLFYNPIIGNNLLLSMPSCMNDDVLISFFDKYGKDRVNLDIFSPLCKSFFKTGSVDIIKYLANFDCFKKIREKDELVKEITKRIDLTSQAKKELLDEIYPSHNYRPQEVKDVLSLGKKISNK